MKNSGNESHTFKFEMFTTEDERGNILFLEHEIENIYNAFNRIIFDFEAFKNNRVYASNSLHPQDLRMACLQKALDTYERKEQQSFDAASNVSQVRHRAILQAAQVYYEFVVGAKNDE